MPSRVDLHVHSKFSDRPSEWILRRIGSPECYTEPQTIYERGRRRGMQFVTITDHNCIRGALEIADLEGVFVGNEITTYFPADRCKIQFERLSIQSLKACRVVNKIVSKPFVFKQTGSFVEFPGGYSHWYKQNK